MDNIGRVLTLRITITDPEVAEWIWKAHPNPIHGITVDALANGDLFAERDILQEAASFYIREEGESTEDAIDAHCGESFETIEGAAIEAKNTCKGKWAIINRHGKVVRQARP